MSRREVGLRINWEDWDWQKMDAKPVLESLRNGELARNMILEWESAWETVWYEVSSEAEVAAKRNAREPEFGLCLGALPAYCHVLPGGWTKWELQSLQGSSLSLLAGLLKGDQCRGFPVWASTLWQSTRVCFAFVDLVSIHTYFFLFFSRAVGGFWVSLTPAEYASHEGSECWQAEQLFWQARRCAKKVFLHFLLFLVRDKHLYGTGGFRCVGIPELLLLLLCLLVEHMEGSCSYKKMRGKSQKHPVCVEGKKDQSADMGRENSLKMSSIRATVS